MLTAQQQDMADQHYRFAIWLAAKWSKIQDTVPREELEGIALIELCNAAAAYDPSRGSSFTHFAKHHINQILARTIKETRRHNRIEDQAVRKEEMTIKRKNAEYNVENKALGSELQDALDQLSPEHREILEECYIDKLSYKEIAFKHGLTVNQVKFILRCAKQQVRQKIA